MTKTETQEVLSKYQEAFFTAKWTEHQQMLPREVVESLSFDIFKRHLDTALSLLLKVAVLEQRSWTRRPALVPSNLNHSAIL